VEDDLDRHPDAQVLVGTLDDVRVEAWALLQLDDRHVVRDVAEEGRVLRAVDDDEREDRGATAERDPLAALGEALRAEDRGGPAEVAARGATLRAELALPAALPVGRAVLGDRGERLVDDEHQRPPCAVRARASGAASTARRNSASAALKRAGCSSIGQ